MRHKHFWDLCCFNILGVPSDASDPERLSRVLHGSRPVVIWNNENIRWNCGEQTEINNPANLAPFARLGRDHLCIGTVLTPPLAGARVYTRLKDEIVRAAKQTTRKPLEEDDIGTHSALQL